MKEIFLSESRAVRSFRIYSSIYKRYSKYFGFYLYQRAKLKYGVDIAPTASIGKNFTLVHLGAIVIGGNVASLF